MYTSFIITIIKLVSGDWQTEVLSKLQSCAVQLILTLMSFQIELSALLQQPSVSSLASKQTMAHYLV